MVVAPEVLGRERVAVVVNTLVYPFGAETFTGDAAIDNDGNPLRPRTSGATTTSGGSTAWSAPTSRWSSGWR